MTIPYQEARCVQCSSPVTLLLKTVYDEEFGRGRVVYGAVCNKCLSKYEREMYPEAFDDPPPTP